MSIYRKFALHPRSDVCTNTEEETLVLQHSQSQMSIGLEEHKHLRTAAPAEMPLRRTLTWAAGLPLDVQPTALLRHFTRVANLIAATWGDSKSFDTYLESLLNDQRGNWRGFPPEVLTELATLQRYRDSVSDDDSAADTVSKRG